jgi:hypothetical protein
LLVLKLTLCGESALNSAAASSVSYRKSRIVYGWYIVAVGFLPHVACAFHMSSTLRVFLKPLTGLGVVVTHAFGAAGAPFYGFVHDVTGSYQVSFFAFVAALVLSALLSLMVRAPRKRLLVIG